MQCVEAKVYVSVEAKVCYSELQVLRFIRVGESCVYLLVLDSVIIGLLCQYFLYLTPVSAHT
jgi:hypothetical protein